MRKKLIVLLTIIIVAILIISGCSKKVGNEKNEPVVEKEPVEEVVEEEKEEPKEVDEEVNAGSGDFAELISYMEEETEGRVNVIYENSDQQTHESDGITTSLNAYILLELNDFHTNFEIPFLDNTDGGVIIAEYTIKNELDKNAYLMPDLYIEYPGTERFHSNNRDLLPEEEQLPTKLTPSTDYLIEAGETILGYYAYSFAPEVLDKILDLETVSVNISRPHSEKGEINSNFGKEGKFTMALSDDGSEKAESNKAFYEDKVTYENMGDKKMLKENDDVGMSEELRDVKVTIDGYQITEFTPNEVEEARFSSFTNGIALFTVKFDLDNKGSVDIGLSSLSSKLTVNDGAQYMLNEGMLLDYRNDDIVKSGESDELLQVYIMDQEQYEKIWMEKEFEIEIGPMRDTEAKDISKGNKVSFTLPK